MTDFKYQTEIIEDVKEEAISLLEDHWKEIALNKEVIKLNPDWETYLALEAEGYLQIYTCRLDGKLIGYFVVVANKALHYKDHIFATNDVLYLKPEYRNTGAGKKLIEFAEDDVKQKGASCLCINTKVHQPFDNLMEHMNYTLIERVYNKCFLSADKKDE